MEANRGSSLKQPPNISICIPTFNRSDLLRKTLISVSKQRITPYEVIVVDNCSTDDTESVVKLFKNITYYRNERNLGLAGNWNQCIRLAGGDFLTILHSDDLVSPDWYKQLEQVIHRFSNSNIGAFFLPVFTIDMNENVKLVYFNFYYSLLLREGVSFKILWQRNMCGLPASGGIVFRKSIFKEIGMFDESYTTETDTLMVFRILNRYPVYHFKKLLYAYRIHPFQTFDKAKEVKSEEKKFNVLRNHLGIIKNFYDKELKLEYRQPYFYKRFVYIYMAIGICNFMLLKVKMAKRYFKVIREFWPEMKFTFADYIRLISVILHYSYVFPWARALAFFVRTVPKSWVREE